METRRLLANMGQGIPAPLWMGSESSLLAPRRYRWLVWLGRGPYMQVEGTLGSATLLDGYGGRDTFSSYPAQNYGSKKGSCGDRP